MGRWQSLSAPQIKRQRAMKQSLKRIPITSSLRDEIGMQMHTSLYLLKINPSAEAFDSLSQVFNIVLFTLAQEASHAEEGAIINAGSLALSRVEDTVCSGNHAPESELDLIRHGVLEIDGLLGKLDGSAMYLALQAIQRLNKVA